MLSKILGSFGGFLGGMFGGGPISNILKYAGSYIGNYIELSTYSPEIFYTSKGHIDDIHHQISNFPYPIPKIFGNGKVRGRIIWSLDFKEIPEIIEDIRFFKNTKRVKAKIFRKNYKYFADFALLICQGEIQDIGRVWINGIEASIAEYKFRFHKGSSEQLPDPLIMKFEKNPPAFKDIAYIVFEDFPLEKYNNKIPFFEFEAISYPENKLVGKIKNICIIPASGEYVYDIKRVFKKEYDSLTSIQIRNDPVNINNNYNIADALYNLDYLKNSFPYLEYVSVAVAWFGDSLDASCCNIYPAIEDVSIKSSEIWNVAGYSRLNTKEITRDIENHPLYGGTINDESLIRYLSALRDQNIKIVFNPMLLLDIADKPWRGHIKGDKPGIKRFFNKDKGYNKYIIHYADLVKDYVDIFLIGSELVGLTNLKDGNIFPAVEELILLAKDVRSRLHKNTKISYGADWSEYHHYDGYYNLDKLWSSDYIDLVGIDAYFPLTNIESSEVSKEDIIKGFSSGEGYEYFFDGKEEKKLSKEWAWKDIKNWWETYHINRDGTKSPWIPRSKKIWFTEFGFPSIDKATNQPNVFYDPASSDGGLPKYSNGEVDLDTQRVAIEAFLKYWEGSEMIERSFLYCWDARPYPYWPHLNIWKDSHLWSRGHWVNNKLSHTNLDNIISFLCKKAGLNSSEFKIVGLKENIEGLILDNATSAWDIILMLQVIYLFEIRTNNHGIIEFISKERLKEFELDERDLLEEVFYTEITQKNNANNFKISFLDNQEDFNQNYIKIYDETNNYGDNYSMKIPIVMDMNNASKKIKKAFSNMNIKEVNAKFKLPFTYYDMIDVGDLVRFRNSKKNLIIKEIKLENFILEITAKYSSKIY